MKRTLLAFLIISSPHIWAQDSLEMRPINLEGRIKVRRSLEDRRKNLEKRNMLLMLKTMEVARIRNELMINRMFIAEMKKQMRSLANIQQGVK